MPQIGSQASGFAQAKPHKETPAETLARYFAPVGLKGFYVTQGFGADHSGIDIGVNRRTDVPAISVSAGTVVQAGFVTRADGSPSYGNLVIVKDDEGFLHYYAHLAHFAVTQGQKVGAGTALGIVGMTGHADGIHLHYEVRNSSGDPVDPTKDLHEPLSGQRVSGYTAPQADPTLTGQETHGNLEPFIPSNYGFDQDTAGISDAVAKVLGLAPSGRVDIAKAVNAAQQRLKELGVG